MKNENSEKIINWPSDPKIVNAILGLSCSGQGLQTEMLELLCKHFRFLGQEILLFDVFGFTAFRIKESVKNLAQNLPKIPYFVDSFPKPILKNAEKTKQYGLLRNFEKSLRGEVFTALLDFGRDFIAEVFTEGKAPEDILHEFIEWLSQYEIQDIEYLHCISVIPLINGIPFIIEHGAPKPMLDMENLMERLKASREECRRDLNGKLRHYFYKKKSIEEVRSRFLNDFKQRLLDNYGFEAPVILADHGELIPSALKLNHPEKPTIKRLWMTDEEQGRVHIQYDSEEGMLIEVKPCCPINALYDVWINGEKVHERIKEKCLIIDRGGPISQVKVRKIGGIFNPHYFALVKKEDFFVDFIEAKSRDRIENNIYLDFMICNDRRLALQQEIYELTKGLTFFEEKMSDDDAKRYLKCQKALACLADTYQSPKDKMRQAVIILGELDEEEKMLNALKACCQVYLDALYQPRRKSSFFDERLSTSSLVRLVVSWIKILNDSNNYTVEQQWRTIQEGFHNHFEATNSLQVEFNNIVLKAFKTMGIKLSDPPPEQQLQDSVGKILMELEKAQQRRSGLTY